LFVLEHNGIAQTTPTDYAHAGDLILRAASFGIETSSGVATEIEAVRALAKSAVADVRTKSRPHFLRLHTLRLGPHSKGDDSRTETDVFALREQDPILSMARKLDDLDPGRKRDLEALVEKRISAAVKASKASPFLEDFPRD
jgi:pyruvate dehydrogenase E1 component alpha subunit